MNYEDEAKKITPEFCEWLQDAFTAICGSRSTSFIPELRRLYCKSEGVQEDTVRFEELCKGDAVKIEKVCDVEDVLGLFDGFEVEFVTKEDGYQKWPSPELEISSGHLFVHRNCKWMKVVK